MALVNQYIAVDYLEFDYFLENQQFSSAFTVSASSPSDQASAKDYTWDDFAESSVIDRTWDEWFGDSWEGGVIFAVTSILKANAGYAIFASATLNPAFSVSANMNYVLGQGTSTMNPAFEQADTFFDRFRGVAVSGQAQNFDTAFSQSTDANFTTGVLQTITSAFTQSTQGNYNTNSNTYLFDSAFTKSVNANYITGIPQSFASAFTTSQNANSIFDLGYGQIFNALYSTLTVGRLIGLPDPWNILKVLQETRTILVPIESMDIKVLEETRVNKAKTETRSLLVPQETRSYKIRKPIMTSQSVIPRVRVER